MCWGGLVSIQPLEELLPHRWAAARIGASKEIYIQAIGLTQITVAVGNGVHVSSCDAYSKELVARINHLKLLYGFAKIRILGPLWAPAWPDWRAQRPVSG